MQQLNGKKRVLVTGGAKNLGAEVCVVLAQYGYDLVIHYYKSKKEVLEIADICRKKGADVQIIQGNFDSEASLKKFIDDYKSQIPETFGLVNNVGNYLIKSAMETTFEEWCDIFQKNLHAPFYLSQALLPDLKKTQGVIINIGSAGGMRLNANTYATAYTLAKNALYLLTKSVAKELASHFIRVNMVSPGHLESSIDLEDPSQLPMKRAAKLSEVAKMILFLLSPESQYITGQNIEISGGYAL